MTVDESRDFDRGWDAFHDGQPFNSDESEEWMAGWIANDDRDRSDKARHEEEAWKEFYSQGEY